MSRQSLALVCLLAAAAPCPAEDSGPTLRDAFAGRFDVGTALSDWQLQDPDGAASRVAAAQFSAVTGENVMKWEKIHPEPGRYDFAAADALVDFAEAHGQKVIGHTLVWHSQCPDWVFEDDTGAPISREALLERLRDHIQTVAGRYKGRIHGWDVVNEAVNSDGSWRDSKWRQILGPDYLEIAFRLAHDADPDAELYYNDYSMTDAGKRDQVVEMVRDFKRRGVPIHGVGLQAHWALDYPSDAEISDALDAYAALGVGVMITELDVQVLPRPGQNRGANVGDRARMAEGLDPYKEGLPDEVQQQLADRYAGFFRHFVRHDNAVTRVTLWGVEDGQTWHNYWPIRGRTAHSLLFDRNVQPKPAYFAVLEVAEE